MLTWLVFALFFVLVPNRRVMIKHALIGAFLSTVLFTWSGPGFVAYVSNTNYKVIYGALAAVPIFLFWLYLVWTVILFGASLAASLTTFSDYSKYDTRLADAVGIPAGLATCRPLCGSAEIGSGLSLGAVDWTWNSRPANFRSTGCWLSLREPEDRESATRRETGC